MKWYWWSLLLFVIGIVEYALSESENLFAVRLKITQTFWFGQVNRLLDMIVYFITFHLFWKSIEAGKMTFDVIIPCASYIQGCVLGSTIALLYYKKKKRRTDQERRKQQLEKARQIKKQIRSFKQDIISEIEEEFEFDDQKGEQGKEDANKEVHSQTDSNRPTTTEEKSKTLPS